MKIGSRIYYHNLLLEIFKKLELILFLCCYRDLEAYLSLRTLIF